ncbi:efflux transporter outer membrane subunit [Shimia abyssi]|uniref:Multidrug efflux system outer membrane protein n=1 Tax=Shimia abyssi TaxID=1662395 RepID=A0A2P8F902_9RHOB|nr:efflux transporter outer membrane subunit [Shimia abyssi]PSL18193.1 multidrug efflux system outer membrane protein [Shimia abyssi]
MASGAQLATVAACTVGEEFRQPQTDVPEQFLTQQGAGPVERKYKTWWRAFDDEKLDRLVELGLQQNLDIRKAVARVEQSRAILAGAGYPIDGVARVSEARASVGGNDGRSDSGFVRGEATWQLDLYGKLKREREAAFYRLEGAFADANVARATLLDELVTAYVDARFYQELIRINQRVVSSREQTLEATENARTKQLDLNSSAVEKEALPAVSELDVAQARSLVASAKAELPEARILFFKSVSRIGTLLGQAWERPREGLDRTAPQPVPSIKGLRTGIPTDLVRNRPDVVLAERRLAESVALAGVAEAELYPELKLTGNINVNYSGAEWIPTAGFLRLGLDVPLFDLPERRSKVRYQEARVDEFRLVWEEEVVEAVEEVQDSLVSLKNHEDAVRYTTEAIEQTRNVLDLARKGYTRGEASFLQVLDAERALLANENALALDKRNFAVDYVKLNVALGGFYGEAP